MYDVDAIVSKIQEGQSLEDIGKEFAEVLNKAAAKVEQIQKEEEQAKLQKAEKLEGARKLIWAVINYIENYTNYADLGAGLRDEVKDDKAVEKIADQLAQVFKVALQLEKSAHLSFPRAVIKDFWADSFF